MRAQDSHRGTVAEAKGKHPNVVQALKLPWVLSPSLSKGIANVVPLSRHLVAGPPGGLPPSDAVVGVCHPILACIAVALSWIAPGVVLGQPDEVVKMG